MYDTIVNRCTEIKVLGAWFDSKFAFNKHIEPSDNRNNRIFYHIDTINIFVASYVFSEVEQASMLLILDFLFDF